MPTPINVPVFLYNEVEEESIVYVTNLYYDADALLAVKSIPPVRYRDLFWNGSNIVEYSTNNTLAGATMMKKQLYYDQAIELIVLCLDTYYYPA